MISNFLLKIKKINRRLLLLVILFLVFSFLLIIKFFYKNVYDIWKIEGSIKLSCQYNSDFLLDTGFKEYWSDKLELKDIGKWLKDIEEGEKKKKQTKESILWTTLLFCSWERKGISLSEEELVATEEFNNFKEVIKTKVSTFLKVNEVAGGLKIDWINEYVFKNKIHIQRTENTQPYFKVKTRTAFNDKFSWLLNSYKRWFLWKNLNEKDFKISYTNNEENIKLKDLFLRYWDDIIITNFKVFIDLTPREKQIYLEYNYSKDLENLFELNNIYSNSFSYDRHYIILKDTNAFVNSMAGYTEESFKYLVEPPTSKPSITPSVSSETSPIGDNAMANLKAMKEKIKKAKEIQERLKNLKQ